MIAAGIALAAANAAAYASALFDVVLLALALLIAWPGGAAAGRPPVRHAADRGGGAAHRGADGRGKDYLGGVEVTTLARVGAADPVTAVLTAAWSWTGLIVLLAAAGVIISWAGRRGWAATLLLAVLTAAALLGPLEQARLHTLASLNKHVGLGAWFAAIAAGYAIDRFIAAAPACAPRPWPPGALIVALVFPASLGASQSRQFSTDLPNATSFIAVFGPLASQGNGHLLVETASIARYYLPSGSQWQRWSSTRNIIMPSGANTGGPSSRAGVTGPGNPGVYADLITRGYFSYVALNYTDTTALDYQITKDLRASGHYRPIAVIPYGTEVPPIGQGTYVIWQHEDQP